MVGMGAEIWKNGDHVAQVLCSGDGSHHGGHDTAMEGPFGASWTDASPKLECLLFL